MRSVPESRTQMDTHTPTNAVDPNNKRKTLHHAHAYMHVHIYTFPSRDENGSVSMSIEKSFYVSKDVNSHLNVDLLPKSLSLPLASVSLPYTTYV